MIWHVEALGLKIEAVASNLGVHPSTVSRTVRTFQATGTVEKKKYPSDARPNKKLTSPVQLTILHTVLCNPQIYLQELQQEVCVSTGVYVGIPSLCTFLRKTNFTRQKLQLIARQRDEELRRQFLTEVSLYTPEMCLFVDETGADRRDSLRKYGYGIRGKPPKSCQLLVQGEHISTIAAMSCEGIQAMKIVRTTVDGDTFLDFIQRDLLPVLMPFNGVNPNSVVVLDNCTVHHVPGVESMITSVGALVNFLPPYSPDLNPIEECFSKVKSCLKSTESNDLETSILTAFSCVTPQDCQGSAKHMGTSRSQICIFFKQ